MTVGAGSCQPAWQASEVRAICDEFEVVLKPIETLLAQLVRSTCAELRQDLGRQETWEDSPPDWPQAPVMSHLRSNGRPTAQWSRLQAGRSDDLGTTRH